MGHRKRLRKHLKDNGFFSKYQSGFRKSKSTNDHLFHLSQTIMESFNQGEHVIVALYDRKSDPDAKVIPHDVTDWSTDYLPCRTYGVIVFSLISIHIFRLSLTLFFVREKYLSRIINLNFLRVPAKNCRKRKLVLTSCFGEYTEVYFLLLLTKLWGGHFVKIF